MEEFYFINLRPGQDLNLRSPKEETVFETVALPLDYLGILLLDVYRISRALPDFYDVGWELPNFSDAGFN